MVEEPNANVTPPGSSESFNQFTNRVIGTIKGIKSDNDGHNTVVVTHSKPIKAFMGWEHAGYPDDTRDISMSAYHDNEQKPGKHEEVSIPYQVAMESPDDRIRSRLGVRPGANEGGGTVDPATGWPTTKTESAESIKPTGNAQKILKNILEKQGGDDMESVKDLYMPKLEKLKDLK
jgi:Histidine phosphatase superfamily (branch 1)